MKHARTFTAARLLFVCASLLTIGWIAIPPVHAASAIPLGAATPFAVLGASTVTNTGNTVITGDVGVAPGSSLTGFPPGTITGTLHINDAVASAAQASSVAAYGLLAAQACDASFAAPTDVAGMTLLPGTYCFGSSVSNSGLLTLDAGGNSSAVWIFRAASTLVTGSGSSVVPINGGQDCNVFWQVGSSATLGTSTQMVGNLLALASITLNTGSSMSGRLLAQTGAVTLEGSQVSLCAAPQVVTPTIAKSFNPATIVASATSRLTVTLTNPAAFVITTTAPLVDSLPAGVLVAMIPNAGTTCGGGLVPSATAGGNLLTLPAGANMGINGSCTMSVDVTAAVVGVYVNTLAIGVLQTSNGNNLQPATATLNVVASGVPIGADGAAAVPAVVPLIGGLIAIVLGVFGYLALRRRP